MTKTASRASDVDGRCFPITEGDIVRGALVRTMYADGTVSGFSDHVIVDVYDVDAQGRRAYEPTRFDRMVRLARPYAFVSGANTSCPTVLTGVETYEVAVEALTRANSSYRLVVQSTGKADSYIMGGSV